MPVFYQLAIVLFVLFSGLLAISILQKRIRFKSVLVFAVILILSLGSAWLGYSSQRENKQAPLVRAGVAASAGQADKALEFLKTEVLQSIRDPLFNLFKARLYLLNNNQRVAAYYYALVENALSQGHKLSGVDAEGLREELDAVHSLERSDKMSRSDEAFHQYLIQTGLDPKEYGFGDQPSAEAHDGDEPPQADEEEIKNLILSQLRDEVEALADKDEILADIAERTDLARSIQEMTRAEATTMTDMLPDGTSRELKLSELVEEGMELYEKEKKDGAFNMALVEACMLLSDYEGAKEILMNAPMAQNLAILSELIMAGKIDPSDLDELVDCLPEEAYEKVLEQYESLYENLENRDEGVEAQRVKERMEALKTESRNPQLAGIREEISRRISADEKDKSHLNLQLAKISVFLTDDQQADAYIDKAVDNMDTIVNEDVVETLGALSGLQLEGDESFEELKVIPEKVRGISDEVLGVKLPPDLKDLNTKFENHVSGYFTRKAVEVSITKIDTANYPEIRAYVQFGFDTGEEYNEQIRKQDLKVIDTGSALNGYALDRIKVDKSNIILCVDVSPSMEPFFNDLRTACLQFVARMTKNEQVGIVAFDSGIMADLPFEKNKEALEASINNLVMGSGTNIHNGVIQSLSKFGQQEGENNVIIVLSDGANNNPVSEEEMDYVAELCLKTGATIYTIGLGEEVDGAYLSSLAQRGNGRFIYSPASNQLEAFYDFLHNQIRNQYRLTYQAPQQEILDRYLEVELTGRQTKGMKPYSLISSKELTVEEEAALIELMDETAGLFARGLDKRCIIKGDKSQEEINLIGGGFSSLKASEISLELQGYGPIKQERIRIIDNEHIGIRLPENLPIGTYGLKVALRDRTYVFKDELQVLKSGQVKFINFGPYRISANEIKDEGGNRHVLKGNVQINDFLRYKGNLAILGDYRNEHYIRLVPESESYISFRKGKTPNFLVDEAFLKYNLNLDLTKWDSFSISRDGSPVGIDLPAGINMGFLQVPASRLTFYPDHLELMTYKLNLNLPMQKYIFLAAGAKPISFEGEFKILLTPEQIAYAGSFALESDGSLLGKRMMKILELKKLKASANTMKGDFTFEVGTGLTFWRSEKNELGVKLGWKECKFDELQIRLPWELEALETPVPVIIKEITGGVGNLRLSASDGWDKLSKVQYILQTDILVAKASQVLPFLSSIDWLKDRIPGLLLVDDAKASLTFEKFALAFDAKLKLFEEFDIGAVELAIGHYEYTNSLLNMGPSETVGLHLKNTQGIDLNFEKLKFKLQCAVGIDANDLGMFLQTTGIASASIDIWGFKREFGLDGDALIAVHRSQAGNQFTIGLRGRDIVKNKAADFRFYVNGEKIAIVGIDIPFTEKNVIEINL